VKSRVSFADPIRVIRFASILWICYVIALAVISESFGDPRHGETEIVFYVLLGAVALFCLGLSLWSWIQDRLGRLFLPLMITFITATPILVTWLFIWLFPWNILTDSQGLILRLLPFLLVGFLLVAWQYKWQYMLLIVLGIAALNASLIWSFPSPGAPPGSLPFRGVLIVPLIQTVVFLAVGFSISYLMSRLRKQQESLETANIRLTHYSSTLEQLTTTRERSRLARELHDTLAHTLSGLAVQLETIKAYWDVDHDMARSSLEKSIATAHSGLEETRRALKALRASPLDDLGLGKAIKTMVENTASQANLALDLSVADSIPVMSPDVEQAIYRIAQEAVTNVISHANAREISVQLGFSDGRVKLVVHDNGSGFDVEKATKTSQFGLTGMKERAEIVGGDLNITSKTGHGTTVQFLV
jgi:signal transduction histidine kinase